MNIQIILNFREMKRANFYIKICRITSNYYKSDHYLKNYIQN